jgi:hypothetical protein
MFPSDSVAQLYSQAPGFLLIAFYDSQGYTGDILTHLHTGNITHYMDKFRPLSHKHVRFKALNAVGN